jgi:hypothetical protein
MEKCKCKCKKTVTWHYGYPIYGSFKLCCFSVKVWVKTSKGDIVEVTLDTKSNTYWIYPPNALRIELSLSQFNRHYNLLFKHVLL